MSVVESSLVTAVDPVMPPKANRFREWFVARRKMLMIAAGCLLWIAGWKWLLRYGTTAVQLYMVLSGFVLIFTNLSRRARRAGELSPYPVFNPKGERLPGQIDMSSFGIAGMAPADGKRNFHASDSDEDEGPRELSASGDLSRYDPLWLRELAKSKPKLSDKCLCGSGKRFSACCYDLRIRIRQLGMQYE
jgi:hypothetical protein